MKKVLITLALLCGLAVAPTEPAHALSTADFTVSPEPTPATTNLYREMHVGTTYTFDATGLVVCDTAPPAGRGCGYTWYGTYKTYGGGTNYLVQLGSNKLKVTWTATDFAASKTATGGVTFTLKVTSDNSTHRFITVSKRFVVVP